MVVYRRKRVVKPDEVDKIATNKGSRDEFSDWSLTGKNESTAKRVKTPERSVALPVITWKKRLYAEVIFRREVIFMYTCFHLCY
ncbi:hypothetical protein TNIN_260561 [Trichonephila inaurata madagascariensis]|uniref:Uncharacterized protein n=1 Tax=Trichonephila inaurata madagascariensis TaxID=2747483 RepID=A0A8X6WY04_9ARAC|nr:hypothetical protein TNIN_260561 [Trichonephila inaurata madagascariensis]